MFDFYVRFFVVLFFFRLCSIYARPSNARHMHDHTTTLCTLPHIGNSTPHPIPNAPKRHNQLSDKPKSPLSALYAAPLGQVVQQQQQHNQLKQQQQQHNGSNLLLSVISPDTNNNNHSTSNGHGGDDVVGSFSARVGSPALSRSSNGHTRLVGWQEEQRHSLG